MNQLINNIYFLPLKGISFSAVSALNDGIHPKKSKL